MSWGLPVWLWGLLGVLLLLGIVVVATRRHRARLARRFHGAMLERVLPRLVRMRRGVRDGLSLGGLALLIIAVAEPRYGKEVQEIESRGVDVVLVVDVSKSMDARDIDPSRLGRVQREILDLIDLLEGDRVGLVIYAGGAWPRMPLTRDYDALEMLVGELNTGLFRAQGSELGEALRIATTLLHGDNSATGRAILILSDGETHDPVDARAAAELAVAEGVVIYGMGIGEEPAPIPLKEGGELEVGGRVVLTTPDDKLLRELARLSGGAYVQSVASARDIEEIYRDGIRGQLMASSRGTVRQEVWQSGFQWPLGLGLLFLLLAAWGGDGRRPWGGIATLLLALGLFAPVTAQAVGPAEGDALYRAGRYGDAAEVFTEVSLDHPLDAEIHDRLGAARFRAGDYEGAARAFDRAAELRGGDPGAAYNAGNAHYLAGRLDEALARYDAVLAQQPDHRGASHNRQVLLEEIRQRMAELPPEPPPPDEGSPQEGDRSEGDQQSDGASQSGEPGEGEPGSESEDGSSDEEEGAGQGGAPSGAPPEADGGQPAGRPEDAQMGESGQDSGSKRPESGDGSQERDDDSESGTANLDELGDEPSEEGSGAGSKPFAGAPEDDGPVTAAQAERLLEGVEEGLPEVHIPGHSGDKPW